VPVEVNIMMAKSYSHCKFWGMCHGHFLINDSRVRTFTRTGCTIVESSREVEIRSIKYAIQRGASKNEFILHFIYYLLRTTRRMAGSTLHDDTMHAL
jgi:hypothetical protein